MSRFNYYHNRTADEFQDDVDTRVDKLKSQGWNYLSHDTNQKINFSRQKCVTCGTPLGGSRYPLMGVHEQENEAEQIGVSCFDCVHLFANGEIAH